MANTYITSGSRFRPYTFAEMLQPVQMYTDAYNKVEDELTNLDIMAGDVASKLTDNPEDQELKKLYEAFNTELTNASEELYSKGLSTQTRKRLSGLKAQYAEKLNPINEAYKAYVEDQKYLTRLKREHPEMLVEGIGNSISDYMYGNTPAGVSANLNTITESSRVGAAGLSKQFVESIGLKGVDGYIGQYLMHGKVSGISPEMVADFTAKFVDSKAALTTEGGKALYNLFEQERASSNYYDMSPDAQKQIDASIIKGMIQGISYDEDIKYMGDNYWDTENTKLNYELNKIKLDDLRNPKTPGVDNLRVHSSAYEGENYDLNNILKVLSQDESTGFKPVTYAGETINSPIQAYNTIHQYDEQINSILAELKKAEKEGVKVHKYLEGNNFSNFEISQVYLPTTGISQERIEELNSLSTSLTALERKKASATLALEGTAITEKEVARMREYMGSNKTGTLSFEEIQNFDLKVRSDMTTSIADASDVEIFTPSYSKEGFNDILDDVIPHIPDKNPKIKTKSEEEPSKKQIEALKNKDNIAKITIDYKAARLNAVKFTLHNGEVYYVDASYFQDLAKDAISNINFKFEELQSTSGLDRDTKGKILNGNMAANVKAIQKAYNWNVSKRLSGTLSKEEYNE